MSGLAVAVDFDRPDPGPEPVVRMLAAMPHRSPDGTFMATAPHAVLGMALRATTARERAAAQPLHDPESGLWLVADARIDNRDEVARALGLAAPPLSDAQLILSGFARWGAALASRLEGDFAFAVWDERRRVLTAARDPMGLRPLFWREADGRFLLASEVDALLDGGGAAEVEPAAVLDFLLDQAGPIERTFFRGIRRLRPGHVLEASAEGVRDLGHFRPLPPCPEPPPPGEAVAGFRSRFRDAVAARLESEGPVVLTVSGGLDSSAIACMAEDLFREDDKGRPSIRLVSASFEGFQARIDSPFLQAVIARVRFPCERWDVAEVLPAGPGLLPRAHPVRDDMPGVFSRVLKTSIAQKSRVLLLGLGGDELLHEFGIFVDLARHGHVLALARETLFGRPYTVAPGHRIFVGALRSALPPWSRRAFRKLFPHRAPAPPPWLGPELRPLWPQPNPPSLPAAPSKVQSDVRRLLGSSRAHLTVEWMELEAARSGLQLRLPFLDEALVEWVYAIPWEQRLPRGLLKRLLRDAMAGIWPEELAGRREVAIGDDYLIWYVSSSVRHLAAVIEESPWEAAAFVNREEAARLLASARGSSRATCRDWTELWSMVALEMWLRDLRRRTEGFDEEDAERGSGPRRRP